MADILLSPFVFAGLAWIYGVGVGLIVALYIGEPR